MPVGKFKFERSYEGKKEKRAFKWGVLEMRKKKYQET
jgi:hypothetical protein